MLNDRTTLKDLSIFTSEQDGSVFALLDSTITAQGKEVLRKHILHPADDYNQLQKLQDTIKFWAANLQEWPTIISNGTLVMLERYFESADHASAPPSSINLLFGTFFQKILNKDEYSFTQFSVSHLSDFFKGCTQLTGLLDLPALPVLLRVELEDMKEQLNHELAEVVMNADTKTPFRQLAHLSFRVRREMKQRVYGLIRAYAKLDAWQSMANTTRKHNWVFPDLLPAGPLCFEAKGLFHPLLKQPVVYDIDFSKKQNFLLLTGANMSGKTTFMRSLGVAALLAHLGLGVPATTLRISFLSGIISNMHVEDNLMLGESYFFAEVQRMKLTAQKMQQAGSYLVLMDELFKGTNVHDAYECTRAVIEGLLNKSRHIMILSTHLHEVAGHFENKPEVIFKYFVTNVTGNGSYQFTYELKDGISQDRIGYRILQHEGVIDLLKNGY